MIFLNNIDLYVQKKLKIFSNFKFFFNFLPQYIQTIKNFYKIIAKIFLNLLYDRNKNPKNLLFKINFFDKKSFYIHLCFFKKLQKKVFEKLLGKNEIFEKRSGKTIGKVFYKPKKIFSLFFCEQKNRRKKGILSSVKIFERKFKKLFSFFSLFSIKFLAKLLGGFLKKKVFFLKKDRELISNFSKFIDLSKKKKSEQYSFFSKNLRNSQYIQEIPCLKENSDFLFKFTGHFFNGSLFEPKKIKINRLKNLGFFLDFNKLLKGYNFYHKVRYGKNNKKFPKFGNLKSQKIKRSDLYGKKKINELGSIF